ncbi:antibiotic biosynthesis monooxygenase [Streptomyces sp. NPDC055078]
MAEYVTEYVAEFVTVQPDARPDLGRTGVGVVKVSTWDVGTPERQRATLRAIDEAWRSREWPDVGLLSYSVLPGEDGRTLMHYSQWADEAAYQEFFRTFRDARNADIDAAVPGIERLSLHSYELYRSSAEEGDTRVPGCVVTVEVEFDGPDARRQRDWVDGVFRALDSDRAGVDDADGGTGGLPDEGGISGWFHISLDGTRMLNYAEWETADAHRAALSAPGGADTEAWKRVHSYPGVIGQSVTRYTPGLSFSPGA